MPDIFETTPTTAPLQDDPHPVVSIKTPINHYPEVESVSFQKQDPNEKVLVLLRRHFITNVSWIIGFALLLLLPLVVFSFLGSSFITDFMPERFIPISLATYYLIVMLYGLVKYLNWYYNIFIITQKRVIDIDFSDVIYHDVAITKIEEIEDVHFTQTGFLSTIFNFGDIFIQTQGNKANFEALAVPNPSRVANLIVELIGKGGQDD